MLGRHPAGSPLSWEYLALLLHRAEVSCNVHQSDLKPFCFKLRLDVGIKILGAFLLGYNIFMPHAGLIQGGGL